MAAPKRILLSGYYGFSNTGDEAVLSAIIAGLKSHSADVEITVLSASPADTAHLHNVSALPRMSISHVTRAIKECDLFISGGGSLLQDATSLKSLVYYLLVIGLAKRYRRKVMILGQGIGPLRRGISRKLTARTLSGVDLITVRDSQSAELLRELGVGGKIEVTADPTLALDACSAEESARLWSEAGFRDGDDVIALSLRKWPESPELEGMASKALTEIAQQIPVKFLLVTMQRPQDEVLAHGIARSTGLGDRITVQPETWTAEQLLGVLERCRLVLGMRLHALIFAAAAGVPSLGIEYDPKVERFVEATGQAGISLDECAEGLLAKRAFDVWNRRGELASNLVGAVPAMKNAAEESFRLAAELLADKE